MKVNKYVKYWYDEEYDVKDEDFYVENAYWIIEKSWIKGSLIHGVLAMIAALVVFFVTEFNPVNLALTIAACSVCFFFFGLREFDANDRDTSFVAYALIMGMQLLLRKYIPVNVQLVYAGLGCCLYLYLTLINPLLYRKKQKSAKEKTKKMEEEERNYDKNSFDSWYEAYKAHRYGLPGAEHGMTTTTLKDEVRELFEGYTESMSALKTRYRQLTKKYHPDHGGDDHYFAYIIEVYNELKNKV